MKNGIKFTIAICAYNRGHILNLPIESSANQTISSENYEILIIDNNSVDNTKDIVAEYQKKYLNLRYVLETKQGLCFARNCAIENAKGDYIIYIDDDSSINNDYLENLDKILLQNNKDIGAIGGIIEVCWLEPPPIWYEKGLNGFFGELNHGNTQKLIEYPEILNGSNMVFSVDLLKKLGGFNTKIGRMGKKLLAYDDAEMVLRINKKMGLKILYDPSLKVKHCISAKNLSVKFIKNRAFWNGCSQCIVEHLYLDYDNIFNSFRIILESFIRKFIFKSRGNMTEKWLTFTAIGFIYQWLRLKLRMDKI